MKRRGNIEFLRFVFAVLIMTHHALLPVLKGGWLGVEFFYMLTGYFLARRLEPKKNSIDDAKSHSDNTGIYKEAGMYVLSRIKKIYLPFCISELIGLFLKGYIYGFSKDLFLYLGYDLLFLQNYGFAAPSYIGTLWYLSALFFALWFLYPILKKHYDTYTFYFAPVIFLLISGTILRTTGNLGTTEYYFVEVFNSGFLRAIAIISLGTFIYRCQTIIHMKKMNRVSISLLELVLYIAIYIYIYYWNENISQLDGIFVMLLAIALLISVSGISYLSMIFNNRFSIILGKFSMYLFMNHAYWLFFIDDFVNKAGLTSYFENIEPTQNYSIYIKIFGMILSIITTVVVMILTKIINDVCKGKIGHSYDKSER